MPPRRGTRGAAVRFDKTVHSIFDLKLGAIATRTVLSVAPETPVEAAIARFAEHGVSSLVIAEAGKPLGILTERDLVRIMSAGTAGTQPVSTIMSAPLVTAHPDLDFAAAQILMANHGIRHLVLVDEAGKLAGVASESDFQRRAGTDVFTAIQSLDLVMDQGAAVLDPDQALAVALDTMAAGRLDHVLVGSHGIPTAILTERDVPPLLARGADRHAIRVGSVAHGPLDTIAVHEPVAHAARRMQEESLRHLAVVDGQGHVVGVVSQHRLLERLGAVMIDECRNRLESRLATVLTAAGVETWEFRHADELIEHILARNGTATLGGSYVETLAEMLAGVDPRDRARLERCIRERPDGMGAQFSIEYRAAADPARWASAQGRVIKRDAAGKPLVSAGVLMDVSARKADEARLRDSESRYRGLIEGAPVALAGFANDTSLVFVNRPFTALLGYTPADLPDLASWWEQAFPDCEYRARAREEWDTRVAAARTGGPLGTTEYRVRCKDQSTRNVEISAIVSGDEILASFQDVTERRREQALLEFSNAILRRISTGEPLPEVLNFITHAIDAQEDGVKTSILLLDESRKKFRKGAAPKLSPEYLAALETIEIGPDVGTCGTAAFTGRPVFTPIIASDPHWPPLWRVMAARYELGACWSAPLIASSGEVLGTFAVYWREPRAQVDGITQRYVENAARLASLAVENAAREARLRTVIEELRRWQQVTLGREGRVLELKAEVNALAERLGEPPRYGSAGRVENDA
ncbi:MAG: CBS domain-containing protein [Rhodocyclaceae bacterium]|nr:CBS domain-containing protein [Rhodocyclaceae bacterium]MBX3668765.1 CBS domain-containing protein [Rhodocyclaceae bacterium]